MPCCGSGARRKATARTRKNIRTDTTSQDGFVVRNAVAVSNAESIISRAVPMSHGAVLPI